MPLHLVLRIDEEKGLVFPDRAAYRTAPLIQVELLGAGGEEAPRIEARVAEVFEDGAVKLVRPRFGRHKHGRTRAGSVLRGIVIRQNLELLDGIERRQDRNAAGGQFIVVFAIEQPVGAVGARAADRQREGAARRYLAAGAGSEKAVRVGFGSRAGSQGRELDEVAAIQRKVGDLLRVDHLAQRGTRRLDRYVRGGHVDGRTYRCDSQSEIQFAGLVYVRTMFLASLV